MLRTEAGRRPYDRDLSDLIGELCTRSDVFRTRWANHNVRLHRTGAKVYHHPVVGRLTLDFEVMDLSADDGLALTAFTAADTASQDGLKLLASWAATQGHDRVAGLRRLAAKIPAGHRNSVKPTQPLASARCPASSDTGSTTPLVTSVIEQAPFTRSYSEFRSRQRVWCSIRMRAANTRRSRSPRRSLRRESPPRSGASVTRTITP